MRGLRTLFLRPSLSRERAAPPPLCARVRPRVPTPRHGRRAARPAWGGHAAAPAARGRQRSSLTPARRAGLPPGLLRSRRPPAQVFQEGASGGGGTGTGPPAGLAPRRSRDTPGLPRGHGGGAGRHGHAATATRAPALAGSVRSPRCARSRGSHPGRDPGPKLLLAKASSLSRYS